MFNDGDPEDTTYIYGDLTLSANVRGHTSPNVPTLLPIQEVRNLKDRKNWRLFNKRKIPSSPFFPIGSPASIPKDAEKPKEPEPKQDNKKEYTTVHIPSDKPKHPKYGYNPDIVYDDLPDEADNIEFTNLVDVPESTLTDIIDSSKETAEEVAAILLQHGAALMMSFDKATAYAEAALRDGLNIEMEFDSSVLEGIAGLTKLSLLNLYIGKMTNLPQATRDLFLRRITKKLADESFVNMAKSAVGERHSAELRQLAARVKANHEVGVPLGVARGGKSTKPEYNPSKKEEDMTISERHDSNEKQAAGVRTSRR